MSTAALPLIVATPSPVQAPAPASGSNSANGTPSGDDAPFARELQRARHEDAPKEAGSGDTAAPQEAAAPPAPSQPGAQASKSERMRAQRERAAHEASPAKDARAAHAVDAAKLLAGTAGQGAKDEKADAAGADPAATEGGGATDAATLLAGLMASAASRAAAHTVPEGRDGKAEAATEAVGAAGTDPLRAGLRDAARGAARGGAEAGTALQGDAVRATEADGGKAAAAKNDNAAFTLPQWNLQASTPLAAAPAPVVSPGADVRDAHVAAPLGSPEFAPAVGAQVSLLVREGVQEARLQLNPAEMGPVTVQIQIDGANAQITMSAEQAPTRHALEQALPVLAGALREGGLTLTGGGVFEQSRQQQQGEPAPRGGRSGDRDEDAALGSVGGTAAAQRWTSRGVVDLYA